MANNWNIPEWLEKEIIERDVTCVYCGVEFTPSKISKKTAASWEHIINNAQIITRDNIARCCFSCNASKGAKDLSVWINSNYCKSKRITKSTVSPVVKRALQNGSKLEKGI